MESMQVLSPSELANKAGKRVVHEKLYNTPKLGDRYGSACSMILDADYVRMKRCLIYKKVYPAF